MKEVHTGTVQTDGVAVRFYDSANGASEKTPIVLLHGTGGSAENNFWALFPMLATRHRVVALDFVDPDADVPDGDHYVRQVKAVVNAIGAAKPVHIVGYSFGAVIAALYAAQHHADVASLTLVAGWVRTDNHQRLRNAIWRTLYDTNSDALAPFSVFTSFSQAFLNAKNDTEIAGLIESARNGPDRSKKMAFNRNVDISDAASRILAPSLVIGCRHDQMVPVRHARMLFAAIKDCRYAEILSGHGVVHERPAELFFMIDSFVRDPRRLPAGHVIENMHV